MPITHRIIARLPKIVMLKSVLVRYSAFLMRRPYAHNALNMAAIVTIGDCIAQNVDKEHSSYDIQRGMTVGFFGLCMGAPLRGWMVLLERISALKQPTFRNALIKTAINQCVWSPAYNSIFFLAVVLREASLAHSPSQPGVIPVPAWQQWIAKCKADLLKTQMVGNLWFFPVNVITFLHIPLNLRVPWNAAAGACWNVYLSLVGHRKG
jgi:hypothetical protein